ncbi:hypothetical protein [Terrabacter sp. NPDC080008]|uniref:hypothetical protein n=1 Tax=Terrabacter sp. NPDC080008 TaxID=3155176 RepID=UPI00344C62E6
MFAPRNLIIAGIVLIAIALGPSGHGLWWLVGLLWWLPYAGRHLHGHGHGCGRASRHRRDPLQNPSTGTSEPDPTRDRHEAFPTR